MLKIASLFILAKVLCNLSQGKESAQFTNEEDTVSNAQISDDGYPSVEYYRNKTPYMLISYVDKGQRQSVKLRFELFFDDSPKTARNFAVLLDSKYKHDGILLGYKGSIFHRIIYGFVMQGGDFMNRNGTGGLSIYGKRFNDENFVNSHKVGSLSMANSGPNTNGSQFFICFTELDYLNSKHTVFGRVYPEDIEKLKNIQDVETNPRDMPINDVIVEDCGFESKSDRQDVL